ncbi:AAA family ATPase [Streptomyces sp. 549]|uniref:ATP-binding protein n=1 Tax=Streptomyces sp. 549 TaxID=3049076 RepID=UPI0024C2C61D|nr:AAA family ATPase [Streptomyces sp. 549]MDK1474638.1 AAA family ATPase [Streptomyces sp. 549]
MGSEQFDTNEAEHHRHPGGGYRGPLEREAELVSAQIAVDGLYGRGGTGPAGVPRGGRLSFTGPAGAGKSTVLDEVRRIAADRQCTVLAARGGEREQAIAFHLVRQLLLPLLATFSERELHDVLGDWYAIVGPCVGLCPAEEGATPDQQGVRDGLDLVVTRLAARRGPLVLLVDDAHWADHESLQWLTAFATRIETLPVLLATAYRTDELPADAAALNAPDRDAGRPLELAPLTPTAVAGLLRETLGAHADDAFCHEAWLATGGNPFRTVELAAKAADRGLSPTRENALRLRELADSDTGIGLVERLDELGSSSVRLAWAVAVLGSEATLPLAASMAALTPLEAAQGRERLRRARILKAEEPVEFVHPLVATAVYREVPAAVRVALHGKAAWELVESGQGATAAARHLQETHPDGDHWVVEHLRAAAREYLRTGAPDAARRALERALREPPIGQARADVLYELGSPALMHDPVASARHLRSALEEPEATVGLRQNATMRLARALTYSDRLPEAVTVMEEEAARATDSRARLRLLAEHFMMAAFTAEDGGAPARSRRLARITERLTGRDRTERYLFGLRAWDAMVRGEPMAVALEHAERSLALGDMRWTDEDWGFEVPTLVALTFLHCDRPDRADELFARGVGEFERQGWRGVPLALGYTFLGHVRYRSGRLTDAEDFVRAGLRLADRVGPATPVHCSATASLLQILLARGRTAAAAELAAEHGFAEPFPSGVFPDAQAVRGELLLARGMAKEAATDLAEVGRRFDARGMRNPGWCPWLPHLALATEATDPQRARDLVAEAVRRAERFGAPSVLGQTLRVASRLSEPARRVETLQRAVHCLERSPAASERASALVELGALLRRAGRTREAAECLYRGVDEAAQCGAEAVVSQAREELDAAALRPRRLDPPG